MPPRRQGHTTTVTVDVLLRSDVPSCVTTGTFRVCKEAEEEEDVEEEEEEEEELLWGLRAVKSTRFATGPGGRGGRGGTERGRGVGRDGLEQVSAKGRTSETSQITAAKAVA